MGDAVAHQTAVDSGATTQAFLAGGLGHISPKRNALLAQQIIDSEEDTLQNSFSHSQFTPILSRP